MQEIATLKISINGDKFRNVEVAIMENDSIDLLIGYPTMKKYGWCPMPCRKKKLHKKKQEANREQLEMQTLNALETTDDDMVEPWQRISQDQDLDEQIEELPGVAALEGKGRDAVLEVVVETSNCSEKIRKLLLKYEEVFNEQLASGALIAGCGS